MPETITDLVIADLRDRAEKGLAKYDRPLTTFNGRRALQDLYEELLDAVQYAKQELEERRTSPGPEITPEVRAAAAEYLNDPFGMRTKRETRILADWAAAFASSQPEAPADKCPRCDGTGRYRRPIVDASLTLIYPEVHCTLCRGTGIMSEAVKEPAPATVRPPVPTTGDEGVDE